MPPLKVSYLKNVPPIQKELKLSSVRFLQILDEQGNCNEKIKPKISESTLREWYKLMVLTRKTDEKLFVLQRQGRISTFAQVKGQEASQIGSVGALQKEDWIVQAFRETAAMLMRGVPPKNIMAYYGGDGRGSVYPEGTNMLPIAIPVGSQIPHAVGIAWGMKLKKEKNVCLVYFGDGATSEGDFHEAMNFAGVFQLPCIFVCQNNQWAISVPRARQTASASIAQKAVAYGFEGIQVDGNDVFAVYAATQQAVQKARVGKGPTLIECYTYRLADHTTSDDAKRYRDEKEVAAWIKKDPLVRFKKYLEKKKIWNTKYEEAIQKEIEGIVERNVQEYENMGVPPVEYLFNHMYKEMPPALKEQLAYIKQFERKKE